MFQFIFQFVTGGGEVAQAEEDLCTVRPHRWIAPVTTYKSRGQIHEHSHTHAKGLALGCPSQSCQGWERSAKRAGFIPSMEHNLLLTAPGLG